MQITEALKTAALTIAVRIGIHSGPVYRVRDVNGQEDVAGDGIVMAQRIMDCGDAGHILLSYESAQEIPRSSSWCRFLHGLGDCTVKHNVVVRLFSLASAAYPRFGNVNRPSRAVAQSRERYERQEVLKAYRFQAEMEERTHQTGKSVSRSDRNSLNPPEQTPGNNPE